MSHTTIKTVVAEAVGISRKNIYRHPVQPLKDLELVEKINQAHVDHPAYGQYKMALHLKVNHKRTERVMKLYGIKAPRRKHHYFCTISTYNHDYSNLISEIPKKEFTPHLIWVCDVSYFKYQGQFWYLITIEDLATRQILSSQVGKHHNATLVLSAIKQAILVTDHTSTYFHCDQGKEFMAKVVTDYLLFYYSIFEAHSCNQL